jgi:hypothetical protein
MVSCKERVCCFVFYIFIVFIWEVESIKENGKYFSYNANKGPGIGGLHL